MGLMPPRATSPALALWNWPRWVLGHIYNSAPGADTSGKGESGFPPKGFNSVPSLPRGCEYSGILYLHSALCILYSKIQKVKENQT